MPKAKNIRECRGARHCRRHFLRYFKKGFRDDDYTEWERGYKERAHREWSQHLGLAKFRHLLERGQYGAVAAEAVRIESRTNLLFSFEKMALRDAIKSAAGARGFALGLYDFLHGAGSTAKRFHSWCDVVAGLPRRQTRVLTWPLVSVWGFIAQPKRHVFLKPMVTRRAAEIYGFGFLYESKPNWETYKSLLAFAEAIRRDTCDLQPRDMIDLQSFIWVQGSEEYPS